MRGASVDGGRAARNPTVRRASCEARPEADASGGVPRRAVRPRSRVGALRRGLRWPRALAETPEHDQLEAVRRGRTHSVRAQPDRPRHVRTDTGDTRNRGTEAALPPPVVHGRRDLVPDVQRARRGLRCRGTVDARDPRRRRVGRQRSEGVDDARARRELRHRVGAHRSGAGEAQGHDDVRHRHARARSRGAPARTGDRRRGVQRGLHDRRPHRRP